MYNDFLYYNSCFDEYRNMKDKRFWKKCEMYSQPDKYKWNESTFIEQLYFRKLDTMWNTQQQIR